MCHARGTTPTHNGLILFFSELLRKLQVYYVWFCFYDVMWLILFTPIVPDVLSIVTENKYYFTLFSYDLLVWSRKIFLSCKLSPCTPQITSLWKIRTMLFKSHRLVNELIIKYVFWVKLTNLSFWSRVIIYWEYLQNELTFVQKNYFRYSYLVNKVSIQQCYIVLVIFRYSLNVKDWKPTQKEWKFTLSKSRLSDLKKSEKLLMEKSANQN